MRHPGARILVLIARLIAAALESFGALGPAPPEPQKTEGGMHSSTRAAPLVVSAGARAKLGDLRLAAWKISSCHTSALSACHCHMPWRVGAMRSVLEGPTPSCGRCGQELRPGDRSPLFSWGGRSRRAVDRAWHHPRAPLPSRVPRPSMDKNCELSLNPEDACWRYAEPTAAQVEEQRRLLGFSNPPLKRPGARAPIRASQVESEGGRARSSRRHAGVSACSRVWSPGAPRAAPRYGRASAIGF